MEEGKEESWDGRLWPYVQYGALVLHECGAALGQSCTGWLSTVYKSFTIWNASLFLLKYIPMGYTRLYTCMHVKSTYTTSRERIKQKRMALEDILLQVQIVNTKLSVCDAETSEQAEALRRGGARLRAARARVRGALAAADGALRRALGARAPWAEELSPQARPSPEEERELMSLLRELKSEQGAIPVWPTDMMECGEHALNGNSSDNSIYSSLSDAAESKDCLSVKIVRVTNVYKVAYLNHYIKQKRLRRATKHALLKKKIECIKKLFENWQKSLNMATNKLSMFDSNQFDMASQEVMGDYSRPTLRDSSDSDSDMRANGTDAYYDEYSLSWTQNPYRSYPYSYNDNPETTVVTKQFYDSQDFNDVRNQPSSECNGPNVLSILPEETSSQIAIETRSDRSSNGELEQDSREVIAL